MVKYFSILVILLGLGANGPSLAYARTSTKLCLTEKLREIWFMQKKRVSDLPATVGARVIYSPDLDTLLDKTYAVHVTNIMPSDGYLKAGSLYSDPLLKTKNPPVRENVDVVRPTVHFSLGEMVQSHSRGDWDSRSIAVVTPLRTLRSQLLNINPYDTFVVGDFKIPKDAVLLVPRGNVFDRWRYPRGVKVLTYDADRMTLRQAVDRLIQIKGGWSFRMEGGSGPALLEGQDINNRSFFSPILRADPHVGFDLATNSPAGELEELLSRAVVDYVPIRNYPSSQLSSTDELRVFANIGRYRLQRFEDQIAGMQLPTHARNSVNKRLNQARGLIAMIDTDLALRERHGMSISGIPAAESKQLLSRIYLPAKLQAYAENLLKRGVLRPIKDVRNDRQISSALAGFAKELKDVNSQEMLKIIRQKESFPSEFELSLLAHHAIFRARLGINSLNENPVRIFNQAIRKLSLLPNREAAQWELRKIAREIAFQLGDDTDIKSLELLADQETRKILGSASGWPLPQGPTFRRADIPSLNLDQ